MQTKRFFTFALIMTLGLIAANYRGQAQELAKKNKNRPVTPIEISSVDGSGTPGRISKWSGVRDSTTYVLGDSNIFEDKFGKVGIGTAVPTSTLTVAGTIESSGGGFKFPDGTVQTTAGISSVFHDPSLMGNGTSSSPLGIANGGVNTSHLANGSVIGPKIANGAVLRSLNNLFDNVTLAEGANITITPTGNTLTIAATGAEEPGRMPYQETKVFSFTGVCGFGTCNIQFSPVPAGKRLVIKNISALFRLSSNVFIEEMSFGPGSGNLSIFVPTTLQGKKGGTEPIDFYMANQSVLAFADSGTTPTIHLQTSAISSLFTHSVTLTGYYVDVP